MNTPYLNNTCLPYDIKEMIHNLIINDNKCPLIHRIIISNGNYIDELNISEMIDLLSVSNSFYCEYFIVNYFNNKPNIIKTYIKYFIESSKKKMVLNKFLLLYLFPDIKYDDNDYTYQYKMTKFIVDRLRYDYTKIRYFTINNNTLGNLLIDLYNFDLIDDKMIMILSDISKFSENSIKNFLCKKIGLNNIIKHIDLYKYRGLSKYMRDMENYKRLSIYDMIYILTNSKLIMNDIKLYRKEILFELINNYDTYKEICQNNIKYCFINDPYIVRDCLKQYPKLLYNDIFVKLFNRYKTDKLTKLLIDSGIKK